MTCNQTEKKLFVALLCVLFIPATVYSVIFVPVQSILNNDVEYAYSALAVVWNQLSYLPDLVMRLGAAICLVAAVRAGYERIGSLYVWCVGASLYRLLSAVLVGGIVEGGFDFSDFIYNCLIFLLSWAVDVLYLGAVAIYGKRQGNAWATAVSAVIFGVKILSALIYDLQIGMPADGSEWLTVIIMYVSLIAGGVAAALCLPRFLQRRLQRLEAAEKE